MRNKGVNIIAKTRNTDKAKYLKDQGVSHIVNYTENDYYRQVKAILKDQRVDVSFNPVGGSTFKKDWQLLGCTGALVLFGGSRSEERRVGKECRSGWSPYH